MNLRKLTRSPGWWRLFIVLAGLWYGGWLIGGVVMLGESLLSEKQQRGEDDSPVPFEDIYIDPETGEKRILIDGRWKHLKPVTDPELIARLNALEESGYNSVKEMRQALHQAIKQGDFEEQGRLSQLLTHIEGSPTRIFSEILDAFYDPPQGA